jgi:uroporphyrinogen-III synthase
VRVWVTRTQPGADRQAATLRAAGYEVVVAPVLRIVPVAAAPPAAPFHWVLFLSEHAVRLGLPALQQAGALVGARVLAVGARTAQKLRDAGVDAETPELHTSEGLLALPELQQVRGHRVLLVRGVGGRDLLAETLAERGAEVVSFACYRRDDLPTLDADARRCDAVIVASGDGLRQVARLWCGGGGSVAVPVLVPSARVARLGVELGFTSLHDCGGADNDAVLAALAQIRTTGAR